MDHQQDGTPQWLRYLSEEDIRFLKRFLLASGSLKEVARQYGISYPTVRSRLDRLINKVKAVERPETQDVFERELALHLADGMLSQRTARKLLSAHKRALGRRKGGDHEKDI